MGQYGSNYAYGFSPYFKDDGAAISVAVSASPDSGQAPLSVDLSITTNLPTAGYSIDSVLWQFGDGLDQSGMSATHIYHNAGSYNGTATVVMAYNDGSTIAYSTTVYSFSIAVSEKVNVSVLDKCYRYGFGTVVQGYGFSEFHGDNWPFPPPEINGEECVDELAQTHQVIFDNNSGTFREISLIAGASGTGLNLKFTDDDYQGNGSEISGQIEFPEVTGSAEEHKIELGEAFFNMRPQDENNKGKTGYDANGFRTAQQIDIDLIMDAAESNPIETVDIPAKAEVVYGRKAQGRRGRFILYFAASELIITKQRQMWVQKDRAGSRLQRTMTEQDYYAELAAIANWYSRGSNLIVNRATGNPMQIVLSPTTKRDATEADIHKVTGPDGLTQSAFYIENKTVMLGNVSKLSNKYVLFWSYSTYRDWWIGFRDSGGGFDEFNIQDADYQLTIGDWTLCVFKNMSVQPIADIWVWSVSGSRVYFFDTRIFEQSVSDDAIADYKNNIVNNYGNAYLPIFP